MMATFSMAADHSDVMNRLVNPLTQAQREILAGALEAAGRSAAEVPVDGNGQSLRGLMRDPSPLVVHDERLLLTPLGIDVAAYLLDSGLTARGSRSEASFMTEPIAINIDAEE